MFSRLIRLFFAVALVLGALGVSVSNALAAQPVKEEGIYEHNTTITDVCSFPVELHGDVTYSGAYFFDKSGALTRIHTVNVEQVTFTANGKTLVSVPYTFNFELHFDSSGNISKWYGTGITMKIPLPDGKLFIGAGWLDLVANNFPETFLSPDRGNPGNIDAFCAALSN